MRHGRKQRRHIGQLQWQKETGSKEKAVKTKVRAKVWLDMENVTIVGEWGHPARECPNPGKLHGGVPTAAAFKGHKGKGTYNKGKGKGGKGKGKQNYNYNYNTKKSLNYAPEQEYQLAWGDQDNDNEWLQEEDYSYNENGNYNYGFYDMNYNNSHTSGVNYNMLMTSSKPGECKVSGSKYFQRAILLDEDIECESDDEEDQTSQFDARCTELQAQCNAKHKTKNKPRGGATLNLKILQHALLIHAHCTRIRPPDYLSG